MTDRMSQQRPPATPDVEPAHRRAAGPAQTILDCLATSLNGAPSVQRLARMTPNRTGLPDALKANVEAMSGISMDHVRVHRNSPKPAQLNAHAYAQGSDIHLAAGQEEHLPHEAWHVVQQAQGRVRPTMQMKIGVPVNDDKSLEAEADLMGARAARNHDLLQAKTLRDPGVANVAQMMDVYRSDIGSDFNIILQDGTHTVGELVGLPGGGWYNFTVGGRAVLVRGRDNILSRAGGDMEISDEEEEPDDEDQRDESDEEESDDSGSEDDQQMGGYYTGTALPVTDNTFDFDALSKSTKQPPKFVAEKIRNSFRQQPRSMRIHTPFGMKTVSKGMPAFETPEETTKNSQAMVSYRKEDYKQGKKDRKVGKDYSDWADELSDDETEEKEKRRRAGMMVTFLEQGSDNLDVTTLTQRQRAAMAGLISVGMISDPLRTEYNSTRTEEDFIDQLRQRRDGKTTFHEIFGSKTDSQFIPARTGGSSQQREYLRRTDEIRNTPALWQNNCLINAICLAMGRHTATLEELLHIRYNLDNVGEMMLGTEANIGIIRNALGINNEIVVHYPDGAMPETIHGTPPPVHIYHTGQDHFQNNIPIGGLYI